MTTEVNTDGAAKTNTITGEMVAGNTYVITETYGPGFAVDAEGKATDYIDAAGKTTEFTVSEDGTGFADGTLDSSVKDGNTVIFGAKYTSAAKANKLTFYVCRDGNNFPMIKSGDILLVEKCADFEDEKHFYAIRKDGKITFRRPRFNGEVLVLSGENTSPTIYIDDYHNEIIVIGRVLEVRRDLSREDEKE